jgi:hypothetical protein
VSTAFDSNNLAVGCWIVVIWCPCLRSPIMIIRLSRQPWLLAWLCVAGQAMAAGLNDTGVDYCRSHTTGADTPVDANTTCSTNSTIHGRQDARFGRDPGTNRGQISKIGGGSKGFDFTKVANNGSVLPATATLGSAASAWACTYDNTTGLLWEVKTTSGLRNSTDTYSWYDSVHNYGGQAGVANGGSCTSAGRCDTEKLVADINAAHLCGHSDWRLPTVSELVNIVDHGRTAPAIDPQYFPNTLSAAYWSNMPAAYSLAFGVGASGADVWAVGFSGGSAVQQPGPTPLPVRLVRSGIN